MLTAIRAKIKEDGEYRFGRWGTFWHRFSIAPWRWSIALCLFGDDTDDGHFSLHLFCLWVVLWKARRGPKEMMESWGFAFDSEMSCLHLNWGDHCKIVHMPWSYDHCRTEIMLNNGWFVPYEGWSNIPEPQDRFRVVLPYRYALQSGEVQDREATVTVERRAWCWRARPFRWFRWPSKVRTSIVVQFNDEVGEGTGSWKGGCVGCGYDLLPGESPEACLRRMEERKFER